MLNSPVIFYRIVMSHLCQLSVYAWRPTSSGVHSLDFCST